MPRQLVLHGLPRAVPRRVEHEERHALPGIAGLEVLQQRVTLGGNGIIEALNVYHHCVRLVVPTQLMKATILIQQSEVSAPLCQHSAWVQDTARTQTAKHKQQPKSLSIHNANDIPAHSPRETDNCSHLSTSSSGAASAKRRNL